MIESARAPILLAAYLAAALISIWLNASSSTLAAIWFPNALAFTLWLQWKGSRLATHLATLFVGVAVANVVSGMPAASGLLLAGANLVEVAAAIVVTRAMIGRLESLATTTRVAILIAIIGLAAPPVGGILGAATLHLFHEAPFQATGLRWMSGSMLGAVVMVPLALALAHEHLRSYSVRKLSITIAYALVSAIVPIVAVHIMRFPFVAVAIPILFAAAVLTPFQTAVAAAAAALSVYLSSSIFLGQIESGYYSVEIVAASALAVVPPILLSFLRAELRSSRARLAGSEQLFRTAMANSAIGMAIVDARGRLCQANARFGRHLGYSPEELANVDFRAITYPEDLALDESMVQELLSGKRDHYEIEKRYISKDGRPVWGLLAVSIIRGTQPDEADFFVSQIVDIDDRKRAEDDLRELNSELFDEKERLRITLYSIGDAVITTDRWTGITFLNPVAERLTGWSRAEAVGLPLNVVFKLTTEATGSPVPSPVEECLKRGQPYYLQDGVALITRDGRLVSIQDSAAPVRGPDGVVHGAVLVFQDVSESRSLQRELFHLAMHDPLTGLPNRRSYEEHLGDACADAGSRVAHHVVGYIDLDRFKLINDTAGHAAGDAALVEVARLLKSMLRGQDLLARLGGDEFGLVLFDCSIDKAVTIGERVVAAIRSMSFHWEGRSYELGASLGLTEIAGGRRDPAELMMQADIACYAAKTGGRNRVVVYHGESQDAIRHRQDMDIATSIKTAVEQGRFRLFAQEICSLADQPSTGRSFEVFIRLVGTDGEYLSPAFFIPAAEKYNLMGSIDRWVISETLSLCGEFLREDPSNRLSINISADSIDESDIGKFIADAISTAGIQPDQLCFEITETAVMTKVGSAVEFVSKIQKIGARIALDDFGVGMSSFSYLRLFKADAIKIDGSFIREVVSVARDREIVGAIVGLGRALDIKIVAEGIETAEQLDTVRELGVPYGQGYHFGRPQPIETALGLEKCSVGFRATA